MCIRDRLKMIRTAKANRITSIADFISSRYGKSHLLGGLALYYVAVLDRNAFNVRYASFVTPALYTLIAAGLAGFGRWWKPLPYLCLLYTSRCV